MTGRHQPDAGTCDWDEFLAGIEWTEEKVTRLRGFAAFLEADERFCARVLTRQEQTAGVKAIRDAVKAAAEAAQPQDPAVLRQVIQANAGNPAAWPWLIAACQQIINEARAEAGLPACPGAPSENLAGQQAPA